MNLTQSMKAFEEIAPEIRANRNRSDVGRGAAEVVATSADKPHTRRVPREESRVGWRFQATTAANHFPTVFRRGERTRRKVPKKRAATVAGRLGREGREP